MITFLPHSICKTERVKDLLLSEIYLHGLFSMSHLKCSALETIRLTVLLSQNFSSKNLILRSFLTYPLNILFPLLSMILALIPQRAIHVAAISLLPRQHLTTSNVPVHVIYTYPAGPAPTIKTSTSECPGAMIKQALCLAVFYSYNQLTISRKNTKSQIIISK